MSRLSLFLLLALLASALYLVTVQHDSRKLYAALDRARAEAHRLEVEHERLTVEKRSQATSARIASLAVTRLQMRPANPAITSYVGRQAPTSEAAPAAATTRALRP